MKKDSIQLKIDKYYTDKINTYGSSHLGVDWNSNDSQELRFKILSQVLNEKNNFTILDYGCGYGALIPFLEQNFNFSYTGFDISKEMLKNAEENYKKLENITFTNNLENISNVNYSIASGIFNVKLDISENEWENYIFETLEKINKVSNNGFSFNMLSNYSDKEFMKDYLYYADPLKIFDYCKKRFSKNVALLHDYNLYEFSIIVRKNE